MSTHATLHFAAAPGKAPAAGFMLFADGYPAHVAELLRVMLRRTRECHANAFLETAGSRALLLTEPEPATLQATYGYRLDGHQLRVTHVREPRTPAVTLYEGELLEFVNAQPGGDFLHALRLEPGGPLAYYPLGVLADNYKLAALQLVKSELGVGSRGVARAATHLEKCRARLVEAISRQVEAGRPLDC